MKMAAFLLIGCTAVVAAAQVETRFYLPKDTYALGEPVFLYFDVKNTGSEAVQVSGGGDSSSVCSGYLVHVTGDHGPNDSCPRFTGFSCLSSVQQVQPGKTVTQRVLLNPDHNLSAPGTYDIDAEREIGYSLTGLPRMGGPTARASESFQITIDANTEVDPAMIAAFVLQLDSKDDAASREAARVLAAIAPKSQEDTLLSFADKDRFRQFAPMALFRLRTTRSMERLAEMVKNGDPGRYEHLEAARYLAESGDPQWFPLLLETAKQTLRIADYLSDAAESGGEQSLPFLLTLLQNSEKKTYRSIAVSAFAQTGSRAAVPVLMELLRTGDQDISYRALTGLRQLTHRSVGDSTHWFNDPQSQYPQWRTWWAKEGQTAPIYKATQCGEVTPLP